MHLRSQKSCKAHLVLAHQLGRRIRSISKGFFFLWSLYIYGALDISKVVGPLTTSLCGLENFFFFESVRLYNTMRSRPIHAYIHVGDQKRV